MIGELKGHHTANGLLTFQELFDLNHSWQPNVGCDFLVRDSEHKGVAKCRITRVSRSEDPKQEVYRIKWEVTENEEQVTFADLKRKSKPHWLKKAMYDNRLFYKFGSFTPVARDVKGNVLFGTEESVALHANPQ